MKTYFSSLQSIFVMAVMLFWLVPFFQDVLPQKDAGSIIMTCIGLLNTLFCGVAGFFYAKQQGKNWYLPIGLMLIFAPLLFLFYQISTLCFVPLYGGITCITMWLGGRSYT